MNRVVELDIVDLAFNGQSVAYDGGKVTFVRGGLPGERVEARIVKFRKNHNEARLVRVIKPCADRIEPVCGHNDICGGCTWQDLAYEKQLEYKRRQVVACLEHIGGFKDIAVAEIRPSPEIFFYRNKMEFSFHVARPEWGVDKSIEGGLPSASAPTPSPDVGGCGRLPGTGNGQSDLSIRAREESKGFVLGLHERGRFDRIFDLQACHLQSELSNRVIASLRRAAAELDIPAYDLLRHTGFLRFAVFREGKNSGQAMLALITGEGDFPHKEKLIERLVGELPELTTIVWIVNGTITNIARGELRETLYGPGYIEEEIMGYRFHIGPLSFFQTNSRQTEALYRQAIELADIKPDYELLDLYCGAGTIAICSSPKAKQVTGIELESDAVEAARVNASRNGIANCTFHCDDVRRALKEGELREKRFDVVFVDPPRAGMHPKALQQLIEIGSPRLIYISCNPATFARDAALLRDGGYMLREVVPFDMFPHTMHIEIVSRFERQSSDEETGADRAIDA